MKIHNNISLVYNNTIHFLKRTEILEDFALFMQFIGSILLVLSNQGAPYIGTDTNNNLVFGTPKFPFVVVTDIRYITYGIWLIVLGFLLQLIHRQIAKPIGLRKILLGILIGSVYGVFIAIKYHNAVTH